MTRWFTYQRVIDEVFAEREVRIAQWGPETLPFGEHRAVSVASAARYSHTLERRRIAGTLDWQDVLLERLYAMLAQDDPAKARDHLIQLLVAGTLAVEDIDKAAADAG